MTKILIDRSVVEQALEALNLSDSVFYPETKIAIAKLRAALEQPVEQEPFTVLVRKRSWLANQWEAAPCGLPDYGKRWADERVNVYTHPQPPRQPLTDEAEHQCPYPKANPSTRNAWLDGWEAAERAHGIGGKV